MTYEKDVLTPFVGDGEGEGTPAEETTPETTEEPSSNGDEGETPTTTEEGEKESTPETPTAISLDGEGEDKEGDKEGDKESSDNTEGGDSATA